MPGQCAARTDALPIPMVMWMPVVAARLRTHRELPCHRLRTERESWRGLLRSEAWQVRFRALFDLLHATSGFFGIDALALPPVVVLWISGIREVPSRGQGLRLFTGPGRPIGRFHRR